MSLIDALTAYCEGVITGCAEKHSCSIFDAFCWFCRQWIPDPQSYLQNDGVVTNFEEGLQFLISGVLNWNEQEIFTVIKSTLQDIALCNSGEVKCLTLLLAVVCALRFNKPKQAIDSEIMFKDKLNDYLSAFDDREFFVNMLEALCLCESASELVESEIFKTVLGNYTLEQLCESAATSMGSPNQTVSALNMSSLDLNKSMAVSPAISNFAKKQQSRLSNGGRMDSLTSETDEDKSAVFSSSMTKSYNVPPHVAALSQTRPSQSSPYTKLAQRNKSISSKYDLLCHENDELKNDLNDINNKYAECVRENANLKKQVSNFCRELMDCQDEKKELIERVQILDNEQAGFKEMVEKLQADDRRMNDEIVDLTARLRKINSQLDETQNERHSLERRLAHASKEASEISELYNSEREQWILEQDGHVKKVKGLEEALSEVSNYKRQLAKELEQVKDDKNILESDLHLKLNSELYKMEQQIQNKQVEIEDVKRILSETEVKLSAQENQNGVLTSEKLALEKAVASCQEAILIQKAEAEELQQNLRFRIDELCIEKKEALESCAQLKGEKHELSDQLKGAAVEYSVKLKEALQIADNKFQTVKQELEEVNIGLRTQLADKQCNIDNLLENSESKSSEIAALTSKINHMLTKEQTYCQNIDEAALMLADKEKDITEQKQIADELNQLIEQQKGEFDEQLKLFNRRMEEEKNGFDSLLEEKDTLNAQLSGRLANLQKEVRELKTANSDSRTEIDSLLKVIKKQTEETERESSRMTQENMNLVNKIKAMEAEIKTVKEECWKKEEEAVEKVYAQVAQLREQLQQAHADIDAKDYEISVINVNKTAAEEQVTKAEALLLEEEKVHEGELEQLRRKIDEVTEEKQILQESLEIENRNLTDHMLQVTGELRMLNAQKDSVVLENQQLKESCALTRHELRESLEENRRLDQEVKRLCAEAQHMQLKLDDVASFGADEKRQAEEQIAELELKLAEVESQVEEISELKSTIQNLEKKLKSSDKTCESYKKLFMGQKDKNEKVATRKENVPPLASLDQVNDFEMFSANRPVTRQTLSASNLGVDNLDSLPRTRGVLGSFGSSVAGIGLPTASSTMRLRNRIIASQNFADSVPNDSIYTYPEICDMIPSESVVDHATQDKQSHPQQSAINRMSDLQRQDNVHPKSLLHVSSYPVDTISTTSSVRSSINMASSSSSSSLSSGVSSHSAGSYAPSSVAPLTINLPGYVPSRELRSLGLASQQPKSSPALSGLNSSDENKRQSLWIAHGLDATKKQPEEDRLNEIERRNSMYPKHLQSCYPMENLNDKPSTRSSLLGGRKRPVPASSSVDSSDEAQSNSESGVGSATSLMSGLSSSSAARAAKQGSTPLTMPSPQKLVQRVTKGRRSKVGPMDTVPETKGPQQSQESEDNNKPASVFMEFPNTPKDKRKRRKSGAH
ncbi:uncharacterized protein LOC142342736 isoform X2 [Convolutriloba macropyga]|uniref:uncharacterized protein LOC142342736 isoform X2 n=1 Tax=Convolutriloba macropyga TaxID=536237 RepID=UPI003F51D83C